MSKRVLIVGAGITGAAVYRFLRILVPQANLVVSVWEAQASVGGRMATDYFSEPHRCDLGAQYISRAISGNDENSDVYDYLVSTGALQLLPRNDIVHGMRPEHTTGRHYIAPHGTASIVSSLLQGAEVHTGTPLRDLQVDGLRGVVTTTKTTGAQEGFDVVVMATTVQSALDVLDRTREDSEGASSAVLPAEVLKRLRSVTYSSRFVATLYYRMSAAEKRAALKALSWRSKYILDDDVIRYVSLENFKYEPYAAATEAALTAAVGKDGSTSGSGVEEAAVEEAEDLDVLSVLVHTSVPFGLARMELLRYCSLQGDKYASFPEEAHAALEQQKQEVISQILHSVTKGGALPFLASRTPQEVKLLGWEYSQVNKNYHAAGIGASVVSATSRGVLADKALTADVESPHAALAFPLLEGRSTPLLVLAGDAFTESNFDGCVKSARQAAQSIVAALSVI